MKIEIKVPSMGESVTEGTLVKWHKRSGEAVSLDEPIAELETDKANTDVPATGAGVIETVVAEGTVVKVGQTIAVVDTDAKPAAKPAEVPSTQPKLAETRPDRSKSVDDLSPATRRAVAETGVDPANVPATGPGGRLTKEDVEAYAKKSDKPAEVATPSLPTSPILPPTAAVPPLASPGVRRSTMSKIRKRIAENLVKAKQQSALLTTFNEVDMSAIIALRGKYKEAFEKRHGVGLGFMSFFVRASCIALREFERVNGQIDGDDILLFDHVHMGVAVSTERGLTVPVLKHADKMSFATIESEIKRVAVAARDGKLGLDELSGGTFTITNGGIFGSLLSTPIINPPQSAILGMHAIQQRPVAIDGKVEIRPMMYLALSYDHRIIDGRESVTFLVRLKQLLEDPARLLLDV